MLRASASLSSTKGFDESRAWHNRPPLFSPQRSRAFHDDQPYLALPSHPSAGSGALNSLLPCPPASPTGSTTRFKLTKQSLRRSLRNSPPIVWLSAPFAGSQVGGCDTGGAAVTSPAMWVTLYFAFNLSLTLYNKYVLIHFPFHYTLTALHALCGTVGTFVMLHLELLPDQPPVPSLDLRETGVVLLFSLLYTVNIVVSNASLKLVTIPFHQVVRGSAPLFTIGLSVILFKRGCSRAKLVSLLPVIAGVGFATYGDYYCTLFGFLLTLLGTFLAAFKTVITNIILRAPAPPPSSRPKEDTFNEDINLPSIFKTFQVSDVCHHHYRVSSRFENLAKNLTVPQLSLTPMQLLYLMSPLAFVQTTLLASFTGELGAVNRYLRATSSQAHLAQGFRVFGLGMPSWWLVMNGVMAFGLNVVSFYSNKRIGPVGMSVAANVKQVLTVLCAVMLFDLTITAANGVGIVLTLVGGAWYACLEVREKREGKRSR